jgi:hypothetical protein
VPQFFTAGPADVAELIELAESGQENLLDSAPAQSGRCPPTTSGWSPSGRTNHNRIKVTNEIAAPPEAVPSPASEARWHN